MVRQVIRREFSVALSVVSVGRLLHTRGPSPQRPLHRAYQENPEVQQLGEPVAVGAERGSIGAGAAVADPAHGGRVGTALARIATEAGVPQRTARYRADGLAGLADQGRRRFLAELVALEGLALRNPTPTAAADFEAVGVGQVGRRTRRTGQSSASPPKAILAS
jgi:hypothetical protein